MRVYIQSKTTGKTKVRLKSHPSTFSVPPPMCQELIASIVSWQVSEYNDRLQQSEVLQYLTREEVENKAVSGKVGFEVNYNGDRPQKLKQSSMRCNLMRTEFSVSL